VRCSIAPLAKTTHTTVDEAIAASGNVIFLILKRFAFPSYRYADRRVAAQWLALPTPQ
jgi:DMSO/TMAO reductase YedYZ heme-binding membrane subunit